MAGGRTASASCCASRSWITKDKTTTLLIYVSIILHNLCTIRKDDAVDFEAGTDAEWQQFFETFGRQSCPSCTRRNAMHCPHVARNAKARPSRAVGASAMRTAIRDTLWAELVDDDYVAEMEQRAAAVRDA